MGMKNNICIFVMLICSDFCIYGLLVFESFSVKYKKYMHKFINIFVEFILIFAYVYMLVTLSTKPLQSQEFLTFIVVHVHWCERVLYIEYDTWMEFVDMSQMSSVPFLTF